MEQQQPRALQRPRLDRRGEEDGALDRRKVAGRMDADAGHALQIRQKRPVRLIEDGAQTGVFQIGFGDARLQRERNRLRALAVGRAEDERVRAGGGDDGLPASAAPSSTALPVPARRSCTGWPYTPPSATPRTVGSEKPVSNRYSVLLPLGPVKRKIWLPSAVMGSPER